MRKIIFIAVLFVSYFGFSQGGPKMNVAKFVGELTTTERNSLDVPTGERWLIWNATTEQFEHAGSDDVWSALTGSGVLDGDKGDITVSGSGSTWGLNSNSVGLSQMKDNSITTIEIFDGEVNEADLNINNTGGGGDILTYTGGLGFEWFSRGNWLKDADKGDITISSNGGSYSIDAGVVTETELNGSVNASLDLADTSVQPSDIIDDDTFATASSSTVPSSESVKAYVDAEISGSGAVPSDAGASNGDVLTTDGAGTYTWETPSGGGSSPPFDANSAILQDETDNTKLLDWDLSGLTTGTTRTITMPDADVDLGALTSDNLATGSVGSLEIINQSITNSDIATATITSAQIAEETLTPNKLNSDISLGASTDGWLFSWDQSTGHFTVVDPSTIGGGTDDQTLSLGGTGNKDLMIEDGNTIDLTGVNGIDPDNVVGTISGRTGTDVTSVMLQTQAQFDSDGATSTGEVVFISDASPAEVVTSATIAMEGWKMYNDSSTDAATITLSDCDPGETLTVYINRASAPTLAGTGLTFNQLPNTTAFAAATDMMIIFEVSYDSTTIDYYYVER